MTARFGVIGFGAWGSCYAGAIVKCGGAKLTAIAGNTPESLGRAAEKHPDVALTADYRELLARDDVDIVSVVVPNALHEEMAVAAFDAGKHVLLEKPMANSVSTCDRILDAARDSGRLLCIAHELRLSSQWGRIKSLVSEGRLGDPMYLTIELWRRPYRSGRDGWRYDSDLVGSWMLEEIIHFVDLAAWYFEDLGEPASISAAGNSKGRDAGLYDNFSLTLRWPGGQYAVISQKVAGFDNDMTAGLVGTAGAVRAQWSVAMNRSDTPSASMRLIEDLTGEERFDISEPQEIVLERPSGEIFELDTLISHTVESIESGVPLVSGEEGRRAVAICRAAEMAMNAGREVDLDL